MMGKAVSHEKHTRYIGAQLSSMINPRGREKDLAFWRSDLMNRNKSESIWIGVNNGYRDI